MSCAWGGADVAHRSDERNGRDGRRPGRGLRGSARDVGRRLLVDLVRERRAELGIILRELEAQAVDAASGEQARFGWLSKLERGGSVTPPSEGLLIALANGLSLPPAVVQQAAAGQFFGLITPVYSQDRSTRVLVAHMDEMNDEERRHIADIAETFARRRTQRDRKSDD
ncbi:MULTISPECIES: XRE family transcriptional regulator [unclassified Streptomyces]|uniref:XRE family transcriptional regulator n=1 Tax=unclassified Streptomyces TaxID=2593676 RepID=UPI0033CD4CBE